MSKIGKKWSGPLIGVLIALMGLLSVFTALVVIGGSNKGFLPGKYIVIILCIVGAILIVSIISMRRKWSNIVMIVISAAASAVMIYGLMFTISLYHTVDTITDEKREVNVSEMKVAVLKDSPYNSMSDLDNKAIGYSKTLSDDEILKVKTHIDENTSNLVYKEEDGITALADSLRDDTVPAIVLNESYLEVLDEVEGYESFDDEIRYIDEFNIETDVALDPNAAKNTDVYTVYISGIDTFGDTLTTSRSDVNIIAAINTKTKHVQLVNTPRDYFVTLPNSGEVKDKLTHAGLYNIVLSLTLTSTFGFTVFDDFFFNLK